MSSQVDQVRVLTAATAVSAFTRASIDSSGQASIATNNDLHIGVFQTDAAAADPVPVRLYHPTMMIRASGAITAGSQVYPTTSGNISGSAVGTEIGLALNASSNNGEVIEIAILPN